SCGKLSTAPESAKIHTTLPIPLSNSLGLSIKRTIVAQL
ncbi:MAG: hypothetical protein ACI9G1_005833, partial [Pirellulaceae bacterium]